MASKKPKNNKDDYHNYLYPKMIILDLHKLRIERVHLKSISLSQGVTTFTSTDLGSNPSPSNRGFTNMITNRITIKSIFTTI